MSHELAFLHVTIDDPDRCERILSRTTDRLEASVTARPVGLLFTAKSRCMMSVKNLLHLGLAYQRRGMKDNARLWFERTYSITSRGILENSRYFMVSIET